MKTPVFVINIDPEANIFVHISNLIAIEYDFSGQHYVMDKTTSPAEAYDLASILLSRKLADDVILLAYEATFDAALPDNYQVLDGALILWLQRNKIKPLNVQRA